MEMRPSRNAMVVSMKVEKHLTVTVCHSIFYDLAKFAVTVEQEQQVGCSVVRISTWPWHAFK